MNEELNTTHDATTESLPAVGALLSASWTFTKDRLDLAGWYILISLTPMVVFAGLVTLFLFDLINPVVFGVLMVLAVLAITYFIVVASAGLFYVIAQDERTRFIEGWRWAQPRFWSIAWIGLLLSLVMLTSLAAFIIPAFIIMVYTIFYFLTFMTEDHRGLHALAASTHVVYGRFWGVVGRMLAIFLVAVLVSLFITVLFEVIAEITTVAALVVVGEIINTIVSIFITILFMRYLVLLYSGARAMVPAYQPEPYSTSFKLYRVLVVIAVVGILVGTISVASVINEMGGVQGIGTLLESIDEQSYEAGFFEDSY